MEDLFDGGYYWAELKGKDGKLGTSLGCKPPGTKLQITYKGASIIATKGDIGDGKDNGAVIDIHQRALEALGVSDPYHFLDYVTIKYV